MSFYEEGLPWNDGEKYLHQLLRVPENYNPTSMFLSPFGAQLLARAPLVALGTLDEEGWPWTTLWGGEPGFSQPVARSIIGLKTTVDRVNDPVLGILLGDGADGEVVQAEDGGKMVGGLAIDLQSRKRVKLYGRSVAGAVNATEDNVGEVQLVVKIEQSLGNCPKYLNKKQIVPRIPNPRLEPTVYPIQEAAVDLIKRADLFFISSSNHETDMDTNHRGGPPGFVRVLQNDDDGLVLVYPEYSGNRLYQTLGNLVSTPKAGLVIPDFDSGDVLYLTGETEILTGKDATNLIAHTNLAVKIVVKNYKFVRDGLAFRARAGEPSPYNPPVRYLSTEDKLKLGEKATRLRVTLVDRQTFSPTIARFKFRLEGETKPWQPGQYVALDFSDELDIGYSHMREDDPKSLNDDYLRTFTVSSHPEDVGGTTHFEITVRRNGPVTNHLFSLNSRTALEIGVQGFGGDFFLAQKENEDAAFVAAGVGITPLLAQARTLDFSRFRLYWTNRAEDLALVVDTFKKNPGLAGVTQLFVTGNVDENGSAWKELEQLNPTIHKRRITKADVENDGANTFYLCTAPPLRNTLMEWLPGKTVLYENFDY